MSRPAVSLTFLGATQTVTGSKYLLTVGQRRILVDCGQFQGERELRRRNWDPFPVEPSSISEVLLTHAHLDHCGYLPALVRHGFAGRILCTPHTIELARIVLRDAGHLQERDAQDAAAGGYSKHSPPRPLYDVRDVEATLPLLTAIGADDDLDLGDGLVARWTRAGHILGSASIRVQTPGGSVLFSGDLGRRDHPVIRPRDIPPGADYVLIESTYGDREHPRPRNLPHERLADAIRRAVDRGGSVLIPAFAVDRTEVVLQALGQMMRHDRIPRIPVYVNSPMANAALDVYRAAGSELRPDIDPSTSFDVFDLREVRTADESRELTEAKLSSSIIISSSGMATGGRVLHHLARMLPDPRHAVVLTGYQAVGTRGRQLDDGATRIKIHGRYVGVRAEVLRDDEFSVHADAADLVDWLRELRPAPRQVFCVHGEPVAAQALAARIERDLGLDAVMPRLDEVVAVDVAGAPPVAAAAGAAAGPGRPAPGTTVVHPDLRVDIDGIRYAAVHLEGDLTRTGGEGDEIVLSGSVAIRLRPAD